MRIVTEANGVVDLGDPDTFADGPPHAFFARLRRDEPVWWHDRDEVPGFWVVTRYDDVHDVIAQPTVFVNRFGVTIEPNEPAGATADEPERGQGALSYTDPPWHRPLRRVLAPHFTPGRMRKLEELVRSHAERLVHTFVARGGGDFIAEVARPYPLRVLAAVLDLPADTEAALFRFVDDTDHATADDRLAATMDFLRAANELAETRRADPGDDLVSALVCGTGDAGALAAARFGGIVVQLAIAGNETTRAASAHGVRLLAEHPEVRSALAADHALVPGAVEEVLRYKTPVHYTRRTVTTTEDALGAVIGEQEVPPGAIVYLALASANRDETVFDDADRFDPTRAWPRPHLALGVGEHFCLGAALARLELRCMVETVVDAMPDLTLGGAPVVHRSALFDGLAHLPIRV
jgi:cholest-4-en-3-one 26-monooxygenase